MADILVAGSVNLDRVWRLGGPLRSGGRTTCQRIETRWGGGGFNTGSALLALGHRVMLVTWLAEDQDGDRGLEALIRQGFDVRHVRRVQGRTAPLDILVEPSGERTIISPAASEARRLDSLPETDADLVYVGVRRADPLALTALLHRAPVVAQLPLEAGEQRPAHVLIAAADDVADSLPRDAFGYARRIAGQSLEALVVTDGESPVRLWDAIGETAVPVPPCPPPADTTGAGDVFAAGFVDGYLHGATPIEAIRHANAVAARFLADRDAFLSRVATLPSHKTVQ